MELKLDDLDLIQRSQADSTSPVAELRAVYDIQTLDCRSLVELKIPGSQGGGLLQDLGREPVLIRFKGTMSGPDAKTSLEKLQRKFKTRTSLPFSGDLATVGDVSKVLIEDLFYNAVPGKADHYRYRVSLREYKEPHEPPEEDAPSQEEEAKEDVNKESKSWDIQGRVLDEEGKPAVGVTVLIDGPIGTRITLKEADEGYYRVSDVPEGRYTVSVDAAGYEDQVAEFEVKKRSAN